VFRCRIVEVTVQLVLVLVSHCVEPSLVVPVQSSVRRLDPTVERCESVDVRLCKEVQSDRLEQLVEAISEPLVLGRESMSAFRSQIVRQVGRVANLVFVRLDFVGEIDEDLVESRFRRDERTV